MHNDLVLTQYYTFQINVITVKNFFVFILILGARGPHVQLGYYPSIVLWFW